MYWVQNDIKNTEESIVKYEKTIEALNFIIPKLKAYPGKIIDKRFFDLEELKTRNGTHEYLDKETEKWVTVPRKYSPFGLYDRKESYGKKYAFTLGHDTHYFQTGPRQREIILQDALDHLKWCQANLWDSRDNLAVKKSLDLEAFVKDMRELWIKYGKPDCWTKMLDSSEVKYFSDK